VGNRPVNAYVTWNRHSGVCLLHWRGLHLETEEPKNVPQARR